MPCHSFSRRLLVLARPSLIPRPSLRIRCTAQAAPFVAIVQLNESDKNRSAALVRDTGVEK